MKLPGNFGGQGFSGLMKQAQQAMERAKTLEAELEKESIEIDKGPVKATFNGTGEIQSIRIDKALLDPEESEMLEDLIVGAVRDGFQKTTELRNERMREIMPNIPGM